MKSRIAAFLLLCWMLGFAWFAISLPTAADTGVKTDSVVVLTGGPGRIDRGLQIIDSKQAERLLISGVDRSVKPAELAAQYERTDDVFDCCIDLGFQAVDTRSNALETARWVARRKDKSVRLVTTDWHMRRAELELGLAMPEEVEVITDAVQSNPSLTMLMLEYNKYLLRRMAAVIGI